MNSVVLLKILVGFVALDIITFIITSFIKIFSSLDDKYDPTFGLVALVTILYIVFIAFILLGCFFLGGLLIPIPGLS